MLWFSIPSKWLRYSSIYRAQSYSIHNGNIPKCSSSISWQNDCCQQQQTYACTVSMITTKHSQHEWWRR
jgi:hypothetical protein